MTRAKAAPTKGNVEYVNPEGLVRSPSRGSALEVHAQPEARYQEGRTALRGARVRCGERRTGLLHGVREGDAPSTGCRDRCSTCRRPDLEHCRLEIAQAASAKG